MSPKIFHCPAGYKIVIQSKSRNTHQKLSRSAEEKEKEEIQYRNWCMFLLFLLTHIVPKWNVYETHETTTTYYTFTQQKSLYQFRYKIK